MNNEQLQPSASQSDLADLQAKYDSLYQLIVAILLVLVVVTFTLWAFLVRQVRTTAGDLAVYRAQTTNLIAQLKPNEPAMDELMRTFQEFGRTNPDFLPYLAKYGVAPTNRPAAPPPGPAPAPAKKKK